MPAYVYRFVDDDGEVLPGRGFVFADDVDHLARLVDCVGDPGSIEYMEIPFGGIHWDVFRPNNAELCDDGEDEDFDFDYCWEVKDGTLEIDDYVTGHLSEKSGWTKMAITEEDFRRIFLG